jgi:hypothetical protein
MLTHHDNHATALFPNHAPKIGKRGLQRTLGCDEHLLALVSLDEVGIDVVRGAGVAGDPFQPNPGGVTGFDVVVAVLARILLPLADCVVQVLATRKHLGKKWRKYVHVMYVYIMGKVKENTQKLKANERITSNSCVN